MVRKKIAYDIDTTVQYTPEHWNLLKKIRETAFRVTNLLAQHQIDVLIYGSVARGDVKPTSDIDIIIMTPIPSYRLELILDEAKEQIYHKYLIQATPSDTIKAHIELSDNMTLTILLSKVLGTGMDFYRFGGSISHHQLVQEMRVPGVDKRLVLIQPTESGHHELSIVDQSKIAADILGISKNMVEQRIRVLTRRDHIGRTGVFLNREIPLEENFEVSLEKLAAQNSLIRRRLRF